ncbi:hypothetical protein [Virgibacillus siamensis]|uniref:hypothetical protein n=1 Tax=Virgibacillus siamensis TaxID=480071 RepID=UPI00158B9144|nr:hypothetical protein [Virgibacillus siamensis]
MEKVTFYVHKDSNKIVSKVCGGCGAIKLVDDFPTFEEGKKKMNFSSNCIECEKGEQE